MKLNQLWLSVKQKLKPLKNKNNFFFDVFHYTVLFYFFYLNFSFINTYIHLYAVLFNKLQEVNILIHIQA